MDYDGVLQGERIAKGFQSEDTHEDRLVTLGSRYAFGPLTTVSLSVGIRGVADQQLIGRIERISIKDSVLYLSCRLYFRYFVVTSLVLT